ncbi:SRPBCC family protein [Spongiimicrobium salis]|uniref:SRPBCC family protein n=1 Tax=Spongiimicrobium salis TaxID=1667022 RepID=UPI00374DCF0A
MKKLSFDAFTKKIHIKTSMEKLYWAWGTAEGISSWFLKKATYSTPSGSYRTPSENIQAGDQYIWEWHNWDANEEGKVLQANEKDTIEISFADQCKVLVTLKDTGKSILLSLTQYEIPTDDENKLNIHYGCSNGWTFWLTNLKVFLEHGILLNETEEDLRGIPLAGFEYVNM